MVEPHPDFDYDKQPAQIEREMPWPDRYKRAEHRSGDWQFFSVDELESGRVTRKFKYLDTLRKMVKGRGISPTMWLALALASFKYDPEATEPYTENDGISLDEYESAYLETLSSPAPDYKRVIEEVMKPLQRNGLMFTYRPDWCDHPRNRLTPYGYSLLFPRFPEWDHAGEEHRKAAYALVEVAIRRGCLTFISFHGAKEMQKGEYHADVIIVPPNGDNIWGLDWCSEEPWRWEDAICGQVVRKPKRTPKQVTNTFVGAKKRGRRVLFATWKPPESGQVEKIRNLLLDLPHMSEEKIGYGTSKVYPEEAAIIQPVDLTTPKMEADRRKEERRDREIAEAVLDSDKTVNISQGYVKTYDKKTQSSEHAGKLTRTRELIVEDPDWAEKYLEHEKEKKQKAAKPDLDRFERAVREELSKPEHERNIRVVGKKVLVGDKEFEGEKFVRRYVEISNR